MKLPSFDSFYNSIENSKKIWNSLGDIPQKLITALIVAIIIAFITWDFTKIPIIFILTFLSLILPEPFNAIAGLLSAIYILAVLGVVVAVDIVMTIIDVLNSLLLTMVENPLGSALLILTVGFITIYYIYKKKEEEKQRRIRMIMRQLRNRRHIRY
jgi:magnesium-transporting ATPase (P-type)